MKNTTCLLSSLSCLFGLALVFSSCQGTKTTGTAIGKDPNDHNVPVSQIHLVQQSGQSTVTLDFQNPPLQVQTETVTLQVMDTFIHQPIPAATLLVNAFMEHEGGHIMKAPVTISETPQTGVSTAVIQFTMAGPWRIEVTPRPNEKPAIFNVDVQP